MLVALIVLHSLLIYLLTSSNTSSDTSSTILPTHIFVLINHLQLSTPQPTVLSAAAHHLMISLLTAQLYLPNNHSIPPPPYDLSGCSIAKFHNSHHVSK